MSITGEIVEETATAGATGYAGRALHGSRSVLQLVTFGLGREEYGIDILKVQEVKKMVPITSVPEAEDCVEGVINLRGKIIPVVNLRRKFGLGPAEADGNSMILVVDVGSTVGVIVDSVSEVLRLDSDTVEPPPPLAGGNGPGYVLGVGKLDNRLLMLLDIDTLLGDSGTSNLPVMQHN